MSATSQTYGNNKPSSVLYSQALDACVNKELKDYGKLGVRQTLTARVVEKSEWLPNDLPSVFGAVKVEYLGLNDLRLHYKKSRQDINVLALNPALSVGTTLVINIAEYWYNYKNNSHQTALEGGCVVTFAPNIEKKEFEIVEVQLWGI
jgi:hypothetical protein